MKHKEREPHRKQAPTVQRALQNTKQAEVVLQSKRANFVVFKVFCYTQESIQEGSILSLWKQTTSVCTALCEVTYVVMLSGVSLWPQFVN